MSAVEKTFAHRKNTNSSFDSICLACYRTAASSLTENGLLSFEQQHVCNPIDLWHAELAMTPQQVFKLYYAR